MKDIKIQPVTTVPESRAGERLAPREGAKPGAFEKTLEDVSRLIAEVNPAVDAAPRPTEAKAAAIQNEARAANERFQKMMKAQRDLAMLFHNLHPTEKG